MKITQCYLTSNDCYKSAKAMKPQGIVVHSTGANNKALKRYVQPNKGTRQEVLTLLGVNSYNNHWNRSGVNKCVHAFIGAAANGSVIAVQTLPWNYQAWGVGKGSKGSYNASHIQFEICEDALTDKKYFVDAFNVAADLCAYLCKKHGLPVDTIVSHAEAHMAGYGSNHADPEHWLRRHGRTMNDFRNDVAKRLRCQQGDAFLVRIATVPLNIRKGPSVNYLVTDVIRIHGVYTIVDTQNGWGKLKSGIGWINLKYTTRVTST